MEEVKFRLLRPEEFEGSNKLSIFNNIDNMFPVANEYTIGEKIETFKKESNPNKVYVRSFWLEDNSYKPLEITASYNYDDGVHIGSLPSTRNDIGVRIAFDVSRDFERNYITNNSNFFYYGMYPSEIVRDTNNAGLAKQLDYLNKEKKLKNTNKIINVKNPFSRGRLKTFVYEYNNDLYIRFSVGNNVVNNNVLREFTLNSYEECWYKLKPVKWLFDKNKNVAVSEQIITSGVKVNHYEYPDDNYESSYIKQYIEEILQKDLEQFRGSIKFKNEETISNNIVDEKENANLNNETDETLEIKKPAPKMTKIERLSGSSNKPKRKMTYTEMIHNWIEAGRSVLLRGPSGIGKTERIESLYPNRIFIKLTNGMFPEKVVGSVNLQTGEAIPPSFAKDAVLLCATDEEKEMVKNNIQYLYELSEIIYERSKKEDEKVVILLDELLNVKPQIQSLVYSIVLNKFVESGSGIKLPKNVVIVGTGNQKKYSKVAEDLAEPLEKRFDHILDMEPKVSEWLSEYAIKNNVHPTVVSYMYMNYISNGKSDNLNDIGYFYEEPEVGEANLDRYGSNGKTNDPRGWVSISNMLFSFESDMTNGKFDGLDIEYFLEKSLLTKLRSEWAKDFYNYYNVPLISKEDIINKTYQKGDLPTDINEKLSYVTHLLNANEDEVERCRKFIRKYCDPEYLELYDMYWIGNDNTRREYITSLNEVKSLVRK